MRRAEAHFVECSPSGYSITNIIYVPPVPHTALRDEAYVSGANSFVYWYGLDWTLLKSQPIATALCGSVFLDNDGNTIATSNTGFSFGFNNFILSIACLHTMPFYLHDLPV